MRRTVALLLVVLGCGDSTSDTDASVSDAMGDVAADTPVRDGGFDVLGDAPAPDAGPRADQSHPTLHGFRIREAERDRIWFESSEPLVAGDATGFALVGRSVASIHIEDGRTDGHYFVASAPFDFWDNDSLRYEGGSGIEDSEGNPLVEFPLTWIRNELPEPASTLERFVTVDAAGGGTGTSESDAWTLVEATQLAEPGTTVWIKAGDYGAVELRITNDGEADRPIKFIGYRNAIGDVEGLYYAHGDGELDPTELPLLRGTSREDGTAVSLRSSENIILRNLQIQNYRYGIISASGPSSHVLVDSVLVHSVGGTSPGTEGNGVHFKGDGGNNINRVTNTTCINVSFEAIWAWGDHNLFANNTVICDETTTRQAGTDYYLAVRGVGNIITHSRAERIGDVMHGGHAMGSKAFRTPSEYNLVANSIARGFSGESFYWAYPDARFNVTRDCVSEGDSRTNDGNLSFKARDGASFNLFQDCVSFHSSAAIVIEDSVEEDNNGLASNNTWRNIVGYDSVYAIRATTSYNNPSGGGPSTDVYSGNRIEHCTFYDTDSTIRNSAVSEDNILTHSVFYSTGEYLRSRTDVAGWIQSYNNYFAQSFETPEGQNMLSSDPRFVDAESGDFRLQDDSECIDAGDPDAQPSTDFNAAARPQGAAPDLGAFEAR